MIIKAFKKVEAVLYEVYNNEKEIRNLKKECESLELQEEMIKRDIKILI